MANKNSAFPALSYAIESHQAVSKYLKKSSEPKADLLEELAKKGIHTVFTLHNKLSQLLKLVDAVEIYSQLTPAEQAKVKRAYNWAINRIADNERFLTSLNKKSFEVLPSFENAFNFEDVIKQKRLIALNARMGTGKTALIGSPFAEKARQMGYTPFVVAHRRALIAELGIKMGTDNYQELNSTNAESAKNSGIAICINSITKSDITLVKQKANGKYVLFLDEFSQLIYNFNAKTLGNASSCLNVLIDLIKDAQAVIVADADLNDYSLELIETMRRQHAEVYFVNKDNSNIRVNVNLQHGKGYDKVNLLFGEVAEHLIKGEQIIFYSNRNRICRGLKEIIEATYPDKKVLLICKETSDTSEVEAFMLDSEGEAKKYDLVIISPTITSGVSVVNDNYKTSFSVFDCSSITHLEAIQQMHRFRCVTTHNMVLMTKQYNEEILDLTIEKKQEVLGYTNEELNIKDNYNRLSESISKHKQKSNESFAQFIMSRLYDLGYDVVLHDDIRVNLAFDVEDTLKAISEADKVSLLYAKRLTYPEYNELKQQEKLTTEEHWQVNHFELCNVLNLPTRIPLTESMLDLIGSQGRGVSMIRRNAIVFDGIDVDYMEKNEIENNFPLDRRRFPRHIKDLADKYLKAIFGRSIDIADLASMSKPLSFRNSELKEFTDLVEKTAMVAAITGLLSTKRFNQKFNGKEGDTRPVSNNPFIDDTKRSAVAKDFLSRIGIDFKATSRTRLNGNDEYIYTPKIENILTVYELLRYQTEKTEKQKADRAAKAQSIKVVKNKSNDKELSELSESELNTLESISRATMAEYDNNEKGAYRYSCPECYTPTNNYTCDCCGSRKVIPLVNIHAVPTDRIKGDIFNALKFNIIEA